MKCRTFLSVLSCFVLLLGSAMADEPDAKKNGKKVEIFNGKDLSGWEGNEELWKVEEGELVGRSPGIERNEFLVYKDEVRDFRLSMEVKLVPNNGNSGVQFRSRVLDGGILQGYQADIGEGWWGKLYHEHGRELLWDKPADAHVKKEDWNKYKIEAVGHRIRTYLNGELCVDLEDPEGELEGVIAVQIHSGPPMEVRFRNVQLEILSSEIER